MIDEFRSSGWWACGRFASAAAGLMAAVTLAGCAPSYVMVNHPKDPAERAASETFGYRGWISRNKEPDIILIGIHGFCGASIDYRNLGEHLLKHQPKSGLYAYEVRGQGGDPLQARRGDIGNPKDWYRDLFAFTQLVRERHPDAKVVWFGESMGAMIAAHAWRAAPAGDPPCDALVLSSPIVRFRDEVPSWTPGLVRLAATTLPLARVSLASLTGGHEVRMTQTAGHLAQVRKNPYHVDHHTLRLLGALTRHIEGMNECARSFRAPVMVLHGGNDYFNNDSDLRGFVARIPEGVSATYKNYPDAYHLLMYDEKRERIFKDLEKWLNRVRRGRL